MNEFYNMYIQQWSYNGSAYTKGQFRDLRTDYGCGVLSFPLKLNSESREPVKREWVDEHGVDVYIPTTGLYLKEYDIDAELCFKGSEASIRSNIKDFLEFVRGERLAIYDEFAGVGRKDVYYKSNDPEILFVGDGDSCVATFKVKFCVCDPVTDVVLDIQTDESTGVRVLVGLKTV